MYQVHYLNSISPKGTALWTEDYQKTDDMNNADAVLVRSAAMHDLLLPENLLAIARAGAGVNNIPLQKCAEAGIVPGALIFLAGISQTYDQPVLAFFAKHN